MGLINTFKEFTRKSKEKIDEAHQKELERLREIRLREEEKRSRRDAIMKERRLIAESREDIYGRRNERIKRLSNISNTFNSTFGVPGEPSKPRMESEEFERRKRKKKREEARLARPRGAFY